MKVTLIYNTHTHPTLEMQTGWECGGRSLWNRQIKDLFLFLEYFPFITIRKHITMLTFQRKKCRGEDTKIREGEKLVGNYR